MCNCGNKRSAIAAQTNTAAANKNPSKLQTEKMWPDISFIYTGQSALSITGSITGKQYRFNFTGDKQLVDYRDGSAMMKVPVLKRIQ